MKYRHLGTSDLACTTYVVGSLYRALTIFIYRVPLGKLIKSSFLNYLQSNDVKLVKIKCENVSTVSHYSNKLVRGACTTAQAPSLSCVWFSPYEGVEVDSLSVPETKNLPHMKPTLYPLSHRLFMVPVWALMREFYDTNRSLVTK